MPNACEWEHRMVPDSEFPEWTHHVFLWFLPFKQPIEQQVGCFKVLLVLRSSTSRRGWSWRQPSARLGPSGTYRQLSLFVKKWAGKATFFSWWSPNCKGNTRQLENCFKAYNLEGLPLPKVLAVLPRSNLLFETVSGGEGVWNFIGLPHRWLLDMTTWWS